VTGEAGVRDLSLGEAGSTMACSLVRSKKGAMNGLFRFLASSTGRVLRVVAGLLSIVIGVVAVQETLGWVLVVIGLVPLLAGAFDRCVFAPLAGLPFDGPKLRKALEERPPAA
jgi:hypothetical protein